MPWPSSRRRDDLIAEEEKALVQRGYLVTSHPTPLSPRPAVGNPHLGLLRRSLPPRGGRYRALEPRMVAPDPRHTRAGLETFTPWTAGPGHADFSLVPGDFETERSAQARLTGAVRVTGATDSWELRTPLIPFHFEFDPQFDPESLYGLADASRAEAFANAVQLATVERDETHPADYRVLNTELAVRDPPQLAISVPLPCDLRTRWKSRSKASRAATRREASP